jgi:hypothetical protein
MMKHEYLIQSHPVVVQIVIVLMLLALYAMLSFNPGRILKRAGVSYPFIKVLIPVYSAYLLFPPRLNKGRLLPKQLVAIGFAFVAFSVWFGAFGTFPLQLSAGIGVFWCASASSLLIAMF